MKTENHCDMNQNEAPIILAIETSCDETAAAVTCGRRVFSNVIASQIDTHMLYGGVVPEIASRKHIECINEVIRQALSEAGKDFSDIDLVAVTNGPGLVGALLVGVAEAKAIAFARHLPLLGVHHINGHVSANFIEHEDLEPPFVCLVVSGGHTHLLQVDDYGDYTVLARTMDDAAGEAFDKVARAIGLGYPGGPKIQQAAVRGNADAYVFPHPHFKDNHDYSFSGLKSAVLNFLNAAKMRNETVVLEDVAASFQKAVVETLVEHAFSAVDELGYKRFALAGGVAANAALREACKDACEKRNMSFYMPSPIYCTDNAAMIGVAAYYDYLKNKRDGWDLNAVANLPL